MNPTFFAMNNKPLLLDEATPETLPKPLLRTVTHVNGIVCVVSNYSIKPSQRSVFLVGDQVIPYTTSIDCFFFKGDFLGGPHDSVEATNSYQLLLIHLSTGQPAPQRTFPEVHPYWVADKRYLLITVPEDQVGACESKLPNLPTRRRLIWENLVSFEMEIPEGSHPPDLGFNWEPTYHIPWSPVRAPIKQEEDLQQ